MSDKPVQVLEDLQTGEAIADSTQTTEWQRLRDREVAAALRSLSSERSRKVLIDQELIRMQDVKVRLEHRIARASAWFFTISGRLDGQLLDGCLFRGNCILIFAENEAKAREFATEGLRSSIDELRRYWLLENPTGQQMEATVIAGGRKPNGQGRLDGRTVEILNQRFNRKRMH